jgi:hypothetical protein
MTDSRLRVSRGYSRAVLIFATVLLGALTATWDGGVDTPVASGQSQSEIETLGLTIFFKVPEDRGEVIHGTTPLEVTAYGRTFGYNFEGTVSCTELEWLWGDGTTEKRLCQGEGEEASLGKHTYTAPGIYYPRLRVSGWKSSDITTDTRIVAVQGPQRGSETWRGLVYWGVWTLVVTTAIASWVALGWWSSHSKGKAWKWPGRVLILLVLWSEVPPFSFVPNPLVLMYAYGQNYSYDPRLPFVNKMMIGGDPTARLTPKLNGLIGQTGLDPLDPVQPLADFEFTRVASLGDWHGWSDSVIVTVQMVYANGTRRSYGIPIRPDYSSSNLFLSFDERVWNWNDLNRVYAEHAELPGIPFAMAGSGAPLRLGNPQRLGVHPKGEQLEASDVGNWAYIGGGFDKQKLLLSPDGKSLLANRWGSVGSETSLYELWAIGLDGTATAPVMLTDDVLDYEWSLDGQYVIFNEAENRSSVFAIRRDGSDKHLLSVPGNTMSRLPGLSRAGAWFAKDSHVWVAPLDGGPAIEAQGFSNVPTNNSVYPSPDSSRIAYTYLNTWHVQERDGGNSRKADVTRQLGEPGLDAATLPGDPRDVAWSYDGSKLAIVTWEGVEWYQNKDATLTIFDKEGQQLRVVKLAEYGKGSTPHWLPDGDSILVQITSNGGRRIVLAELASGKAWDLTPSRWDPWFAIDQEGKYIVLSNGRGGFWQVELTRSAVGSALLSRGLLWPTFSEVSPCYGIIENCNTIFR